MPDVLVAAFARTREVPPGSLVARTLASAPTRNPCLDVALAAPIEVRLFRLSDSQLGNSAAPSTNSAYARLANSSGVAPFPAQVSAILIRTGLGFGFRLAFRVRFGSDGDRVVAALPHATN